MVFPPGGSLGAFYMRPRHGQREDVGRTRRSLFERPAGREYVRWMDRVAGMCAHKLFAVPDRIGARITAVLCF